MRRLLSRPRGGSRGSLGGLSSSRRSWHCLRRQGGLGLGSLCGLNGRGLRSLGDLVGMGGLGGLGSLRLRRCLRHMSMGSLHVLCGLGCGLRCLRSQCRLRGLRSLSGLRSGLHRLCGLRRLRGRLRSPISLGSHREFGRQASSAAFSG
mmetsp:Transcript_58063/g.149483  ORF Transcript_58063/g.149483 Transcript_58063/m.149483 type:complete len:149 (-) Transcript_58063:664-1110(-)